MKATRSLNTLEAFYGPRRDVRAVAHACAWAIHEITGNELPDPPVPVHEQLGWFLEPIDR